MPAERRAFTIIELLMVFSIIALLAGMSTLGLARTLRQAGLSRTVETIQDAATRARTLAVQAGSSASRLSGVALAQDGAGGVLVGVVQIPATGSAGDLVSQLLPPRGTRLSGGWEVWIGGNRLGENGAPTQVAWFYENGSGLPRVLGSSGQAGSPGASVGVAPPRLTTAEGLRLPGTTDLRPQVLAPTLDGVPGLSLRSADGRLRQALAVYASGTFVHGDF